MWRTLVQNYNGDRKDKWFRWLCALNRMYMESQSASSKWDVYVQLPNCLSEEQRREWRNLAATIRKCLDRMAALILCGESAGKIPKESE